MNLKWHAYTVPYFPNPSREGPVPLSWEIKLRFCSKGNVHMALLFSFLSFPCGTGPSIPTIKLCWSKFRSWRWRRENWEKPCFVIVMERGGASLCWCLKQILLSLPLPISHLPFKSDSRQGKKSSLLYYSFIVVPFHLCLLLPPISALSVSFPLHDCCEAVLETATQSPAW